MGVHGSVGAGGAGVPSLPQAARLAAMSCCSPPSTPDSEPEQAQQPSQQRPGVRGGGPGGATQHGPAVHQHQHGPGRLQQAIHQQHCQPASLAVLPPLVLGGGAPACVPSPSTTPPDLPDPSLVALAVLLGDSATGEREPSVLRQLGTQLATLLTSTGDRLRGMFASLGSSDASSRGAAAAVDSGAQAATARADLPVPVPLQPPPPPPGPTLTLDPAHGTIVLDEPDGPGATGTTPGPGSSDDPDDALPSAWLPIAGYRLRLRLPGGLGTLADRIDALLRERGITRLQLLLLTIAAPFVVGFLAIVVDAVLAGR